MASVTSLRDLHIAEQPYLAATLHLFGFASARPNLDHAANGILAAFAAALRDYPETRVKIEGHGQPGAPEPIASSLALQRAENIAAALVSFHGVARERMEVTHNSNRTPRYSNPDLNRRVELSLIQPVQPARQTVRKNGRQGWRFGSWCRG